LRAYEVEVNATIMIEEEVAEGVGALDRIRVGIVGVEEGRVMG
jgi:hypothetical protein